MSSLQEHEAEQAAITALTGDNVEFFRMTINNQVAPLTSLATFCRERIEAAEADGLEISDGDVVDLVADNSDAPLELIRAALVVAGYAQRFPKATRGTA